MATEPRTSEKYIETMRRFLDDQVENPSFDQLSAPLPDSTRDLIANMLRQQGEEKLYQFASELPTAKQQLLRHLLFTFSRNAPSDLAELATNLVEGLGANIWLAGHIEIEDDRVLWTGLGTSSYMMSDWLTSPIDIEVLKERIAALVAREGSFEMADDTHASPVDQPNTGEYFPWSRDADPEEGLAGAQTPEKTKEEETDWYTRLLHRLFPVRKIEK